MSNLLYDGLSFARGNLNEKWFLQNTTAINLGEIQEMNFPILNNLDSGFELSTSTLFGNSPDFILRSVVNVNSAIPTKVELLRYDNTAGNFVLNKNVNLQNSFRIKQSANPVDLQDLVTLAYLENSIGGFGSGSVTSVGVTTSTPSALGITNTPITGAGNININVSIQLQNLNNLSSFGIVTRGLGSSFSTITDGSNGQALVTNGLGSFSFSSVGTVSSIAATGSTGLTVTGGPIIGSGTLGFTLAANLQSLAGLNLDGFVYKTGTTINTLAVPISNGQVITSNNGIPIWSTPTSGGNVIGPSFSTQGALAIWGNTIGTNLNDSGYTIDGSGNLSMGNKRITTVATPVATSDVATAGFVASSGGFTNMILLKSGSGSGAFMAGIVKAKITLVGGGGGGAGCTGYSSGGGGAGGTAIFYVTFTSGTTYVYTVGVGALGQGGGGSVSNGGTTSITINGITYSAPGGTTGNVLAGQGGRPGGLPINPGNVLNIQGGAGASAVADGNGSPAGGGGGNSILGGGGAGATNGSGAPIGGAANTGGGGGSSANGGYSGANGGSGIIIIEY